MERSWGSCHNWKKSRPTKSEEGPLFWFPLLLVLALFSPTANQLSLLGSYRVTDTLFNSCPFYNFFSTRETDSLFFPDPFQKNTGEELQLAFSGGCSPLDQSAVTRRAGSCKSIPAPVVTTWLEWGGEQKFPK